MFIATTTEVEEELMKDITEFSSNNEKHNFKQDIESKFTKQNFISSPTYINQCFKIINYNVNYLFYYNNLRFSKNVFGKENNTLFRLKF